MAHPGVLYSSTTSSRRRNRYGYRRTRYEDNDSCRPFFMILVSLGTIAGATYLLVEARKDARVQQIKEFAQSTDAWTVYNRSQFTKSTFVVWSETASSKLLPSEQHSSISDHGPDVPVFSPLEYELASEQTLIEPSTFSAPRRTHLFLNATHVREDGTEVKSTMGPLEFDLTISWIVHVGTPVPDQKCRRQNGRYKGAQRCEVYGKLKSICVQVSLDDKTGWQLHRRATPVSNAGQLQPPFSPMFEAWGRPKPENAFGCTPTKGWNPVSYTRQHAAYIGGPNPEARPASQPRNSIHTYGPPKKTMTYEDLTFEVRSAADPYLEALVLTESSTNFALSSHDATVMGIILMVVGVLMGLQPMWELRQCCIEIKKDQEAYKFQPVGRHGRQSPPARPVVAPAVSSSASSSSSMSRRVSPQGGGGGGSSGSSGSSEWEVELADVTHDGASDVDGDDARELGEVEVEVRLEALPDDEAESSPGGLRSR